MITMTRSQLTLALAALALLTFAAAGCTRANGGSSSVPPMTESVALLPGDEPVESPVHTPELLAAMETLEKLTLDELPTDLGSQDTREARLAEIEKVAGAIASAATHIPDLAAGADLSLDQGRRFRELADELRRKAVSLRDRAGAGTIESVRDEREVLLATCNTCHAEFRSLLTAQRPSRRGRAHSATLPHSVMNSEG